MLNLQIPDRITEAMSPSEIGAYMRELREQFKLSLEDVSERLHVRVRYLEAIEKADLAQLPARVYARGYVQCYAEFLGLDPKQVMERIFGSDKPEKQEFTPPPPPATTQTALDIGKWRNGAIMLAAAAIIILIVAQLLTHADNNKKQQAAVPEVPEAVLASMRTMLMLTPANMDCFNEEGLLSCLYSSQEWHDLAALDEPVIYAANAGIAQDIDAAPEAKVEVTEPEPVVTPAHSEMRNPFAIEDSNFGVVQEKKHEAVKPKPPHEVAKPKKKPAAKKPAKPIPPHRHLEEASPPPESGQDHNFIPGF